MAIAQQTADDFFHRSAVNAEDVVLQCGHEFVASRTKPCLCRGSPIASQSQVQLYLSRNGENRGLDRRRLLGPARVDRLRDLLDVRLAPASYEHRLFVNFPPARSLSE